MIGAPVPGVVNALQVTIPGRSPSVPSVKALGNAREEKKMMFETSTYVYNDVRLSPLQLKSNIVIYLSDINFIHWLFITHH